MAETHVIILTAVKAVIAAGLARACGPRYRHRTGSELDGTASTTTMKSRSIQNKVGLRETTLARKGQAETKQEPNSAILNTEGNEERERVLRCNDVS